MPNIKIGITGIKYLPPASTPFSILSKKLNIHLTFKEINDTMIAAYIAQKYGLVTAITPSDYNV